MITVLAHGVFDVLHPGHIEHLSQARGMGDHLIVSVTPDKFVNKGPGRPIFNQHERCQILNSLAIVDEVFLNKWASAVPLIEHVKPNIYVKGADYLTADNAGNLDAERAAVEAYGGKIAFTDGLAMSSTEIVNKAMPRVAEDTREWITDFKTRYSLADVHSWLDRCETLTMGVLGEAIVDKYVYVEPRGRSAKESVVTWKIVGEDVFQGGALAVANHMRATGAKLPAIMVSKPAIEKTRYVQKPFFQKVFSYVNREVTGTSSRDQSHMPNIDMLVVADFGHGLIPDAYIADGFTTKRKYKVALTVQANSLNWGMNTLSKWDEAHYIVLDEAELRLAWRDNSSSLDSLIHKTMHEHNARYVAVTRGHQGCVIGHWQDTRDDLWTVNVVPVFTSNVVDRIGSGDAFLALTAPLAALDAPAEIIGFIGNIAGALQVERVGNSKPITKHELRQWVTALLK